MTEKEIIDDSNELRIGDEVTFAMNNDKTFEQKTITGKIVHIYDLYYTLDCTKTGDGFFLVLKEDCKCKKI